ncbi:hypothetical protein LIER_33482 [Lithospermum erythrorhizon]|uniref:Uncharacterized protein n=1 Tax=Lithospermum erythrorhizon TaxID=34254 RepID=A0AAV3RZ34_LITER
MEWRNQDRELLDLIQREISWSRGGGVKPSFFQNRKERKHSQRKCRHDSSVKQEERRLSGMGCLENNEALVGSLSRQINQMKVRTLGNVFNFQIHSRLGPVNKGEKFPS